MKKYYNFDIYVMDIVTKQTGWEIEMVSVKAGNINLAKILLNNYPNFDCVILFNFEHNEDETADFLKTENYPKFKILKEIFIMKNENPVFDLVLNQFNKNSELNPSLSEPRPQGNYNYTVNDRFCIRILKDCVIKYTEHKSQPNFEAIFVQTTKNKTFTKYELENYIRENGIKPTKKTCEKCYGVGQLVCNYCGNSHICKNCNGEGTQEINNFIFIHENSFEINDMKNILKIMNLLEVNLFQYFLSPAKIMYIEFPEIQGIEIILASIT